ncbi:galactose oxidase [Chryseolinea sp. H1M3-3]|uniref:Kelch repeat-containing protein n=1 Tax=Chryseolinea sp. H1M3-3 TaxID=3034144 RepID=UPI0023EB8B7A|nr:galactose oxidase [Chryseolinea sp. H1M3-3]
MIKSKILFSLIIFCCTVSSCSDDNEDEPTLGNWTKTTPFKGRPRSGASVFTIGTNAFVGLGYDGDDYLSDFYVMDVTSGFWEARESFPGQPRERAIAFSINGKGYVGLGYNRDADKEELGDFWEYDPEANTWTQVADFGGTARYNAIGFAMGSKGYVGTGYDGDAYNSDFWEYDPAANSWNEIKSYPGEKIEGGLAMVVNGKAYVCAGRNNGLFNTDFWEFDPSGSDITWTKRSPDDDESYYDDFKEAVRRYDAVTFTIGDKAYIIGGVASSGATDGSVYEFDATTSIWDERTTFEGSARSLAVGYVLDGRAFLGTGQNASSRYDDIWEFKPQEEYDESY